ncbi:MAG: hypothetical protein EXS36_19300 [Pedosphaera sp.]|nr:hypothetical protein [Pedosphaera sp.]
MITKTDSVWFTTKGQVVIPAWLRKQFHIEDGTKAVVQATPEGILIAERKRKFLSITSSTPSAASASPKAAA